MLNDSSISRCMSSVRISVEWPFGEITTYFAFNDFKENLKLVYNLLPRFMLSHVLFLMPKHAFMVPLLQVSLVLNLPVWLNIIVNLCEYITFLLSCTIYCNYCCQISRQYQIFYRQTALSFIGMSKI